MTSCPALWKLFFRSLQVSGTTIGGGFVIMSVMEKLYVQKLHWLEEEDMLEIIALAQSAPGAIAVNASLLIGSRLRGISGAAAGLLGCILPPFGIMCILGALYTLIRSSEILLFLQPFFRIAAGIFLSSATLSLCRKNLKNLSSQLTFTAAFIGILLFRVQSIWFLIGAALITVIRYLRRKKYE